MNTKQGLRVALYARFSSDLQRSESIDAQVRAMRRFCEQNRMIVVDTYVDEAKSATSDKRPAFQRMIEDSKRHIFDVVLVHKLDRFSRNRYDSAMYKRTLRMNGVRVFSVLENLDDTPESIMLESLLEGMSEYYSKNLAREVMKGLKENALQCRHTGGKPPLGYYVDEDKHLAIDEKEAEAVRLIFTRFADGYTYGQIISELNQKNYYTKYGNNFRNNSLYSILTNEKYTGTYIFNKCSSADENHRRNTHKYKDNDSIIKVPNGCPQIVDYDTFRKVQNRIAENKHISGIYVAKHRYYLSGLIFCGYCGKRLMGNRRYAGRNKSLYASYRCTTHKDSCISKEYNRYYLEDYVFAKVKEYFGYMPKVRAMYHKANKYLAQNEMKLRSELSELTLKLKSLNEANANIAKAIENGVYIDDIISRLSEIEAEKEQLQAQISAKAQLKGTQFTENDIQKTVENCKLLLREPNNPRNREFLKKVIVKIVAYRDEIIITLNTGLSVNEDFNTEIRATRKEIYNMGGSLRYAG